jgi:tungstate transport system substrate-binding protein
MRRTIAALFIAIALTSCGVAPAATATLPPASTATAAVQPSEPSPTTSPSQAAAPANPDLILATTTSTQDSGLLDVLVPDFQAKSGYRVKVIAVGSGAALEMGQKGDADVLLVHAPSSEVKLVDSGDVKDRRLVMHNDFIIVGPEADPAGIKGMTSVGDAFKKIAAGQSPFVSRGDNSGTQQKEMAIWSAAGLKPAGSWYQESGQGMGATLKIASEKSAYTITDRATYLASKANLSLVILVEGDKALYNVYHVMVVNPDKHAKVNVIGATAFADYITSADVQKMIAEFGVSKYGQALFIADAGKPE